MKVLKEEKFNISNKEDMEKAKKLLKDKEKETNEVIIVDPDAESEEDIKDNYVGQMILQCPTCRTLLYKNESDLIPSEDDEELYNEEEQCPNCNATGGFHLVGKVANAKEEETDTIIDDEEEDNLEFDNVDIETFDESINNYLKNSYYNVESYETTEGKVLGESLIIKGNINFTNKETKPTQFIFEHIFKYKNGKLRLDGINPSIVKKNNSFNLTGIVENNTFITEQLKYKYRVDNKLVEGISKPGFKSDSLIRFNKVVEDYPLVESLFDDTETKRYLINKYNKFHTNLNESLYVSKLNESLKRNRCLEFDVVSLYKRTFKKD